MEVEGWKRIATNWNGFSIVSGTCVNFLLQQRVLDTLFSGLVAGGKHAPE